MAAEEIKAKIMQLMGNKAYQELADMVNSIESSIPTTQNHYGKYGALLSKFGDKESMAKLFILMGANKQGVIDGLKFL